MSAFERRMVLENYRFDEDDYYVDAISPARDTSSKERRSYDLEDLMPEAALAVNDHDFVPGTFEIIVRFTPKAWCIDAEIEREHQEALAKPAAGGALHGAERIAAERERQVEKEGFGRSHDEQHQQGELVQAAICYASHAIGRRVFEKDDHDTWIRFYDPWPWSHEDDKRRTVDNDAQAIRLLEKAGALIAAEIDRLLRRKP